MFYMWSKYVSILLHNRLAQPLRTKLHKWPQSQLTVCQVTTEKRFGWGLCLDREDRKHLEALGDVVIIICEGRSNGQSCF